ncbi:MAG: 30S ribosomal protein S4 [Patescibacteria group bacterium]|nr:30S ribosomal protein S4 [Patescibacteria group bacterium]
MSTCKQCRRAGEKLFLKGERCLLPKCAMVKKNYPPGQHGKKMVRRVSDYGMQLAVKQRIKRSYGIKEKQLKNYFGKVRDKTGDIGELLLQKLEMRMDNIVYRSELADSRKQARQMITHGFFSIAGRNVNIPSYECKVGEEIKIKENKAKKAYITEKIKNINKKESNNDWVLFDHQEEAIKIIGVPGRRETGESGNVQMVVEYYSR